MFGSRWVSRVLGIVLVAALCLGAATVHGLAQGNVIRWRVQSHWPRASSSFEDSLVRLQKVLEERTDGRFQLELYEAGALFSATEIFPAVRRGVIEMGTISPGYILDEASLAGIASGLPFAFHEVWEAAYYFQHMGFEEMLREEVAQYGVYYSTDKVYPTEMVVSRPINTLDDFRSLNIRSSGTLQRFLTRAGAAGAFVPGEELYTALATGVVDGAHWGAVQGAYSMALYEQAKYHVRPALNIAGTDAFIINQRALDALPEDVRGILLDALREQFWYRTIEYQYQEEVTLARAMAEHGVQLLVLPDEVRNHLVGTAQAMWQEEAEKSERAARALDMLLDFLRSLGHIE